MLLLQQGSATKQAQSGSWREWISASMNDLFGLIGKLLPVGVIAGLAGIFYLLDVFSVRPSFDGAPPQRAPTMSAAPGTEPRPAPGAGERTSSSPPQPGDVTSFPQTGNAAAFPAPPVSGSNAPAMAPSAIEMSDIPLDDPSATAAMTEEGGQQDNLSAPPPRYVPPQENQRQPITRGINGEPPPVQAPSDEIQQDEGARIEAETQQLIEQPDGNPGPAAPGEAPSENENGA